MQESKWIQRSCALYASLLKFYPQPYRAHYADAMRQVFCEECRTRYHQAGVWGVLGYWLRVLPDLGYTALVEQLVTPGAALGLMEPVPNAPLPWKGIFLMLLPGLVYLVSQIAQLTGTPWYLTVYYRGALVLILPVLLVWAIKKRFPIWGLIPLGLLYRLLTTVSLNFISILIAAYNQYPILNFLVSIEKFLQTNTLWLSGLCAIGIVVLAIRFYKLNHPAQRFWILLLVYFLLFAARLGSSIYTILQFENMNIFTFTGIRELMNTYGPSIAWDFYQFLALLLLLFLTTLFVKRHGFYAILILVGYTLPTILIGTYWNFEDMTNPALALASAATMILIYRILLTLVVPVWMSREAAQAGKKRAILLPIMVALLVQACMYFFQTVFSVGSISISFQWVSYVIYEVGAIFLAYRMALEIVHQSTTDTKAVVPARTEEIQTTFQL